MGRCRIEKNTRGNSSKSLWPLTWWSPTRRYFIRFHCFFFFLGSRKHLKGSYYEYNCTRHCRQFLLRMPDKVWEIVQYIGLKWTCMLSIKQNLAYKSCPSITFITLAFSSYIWMVWILWQKFINSDFQLNFLLIFLCKVYNGNNWRTIYANFKLDKQSYGLVIHSS